MPQLTISKHTTISEHVCSWGTQDELQNVSKTLSYIKTSKFQLWLKNLVKLAQKLAYSVQHHTKLQYIQLLENSEEKMLAKVSLVKSRVMCKSALQE